MGNDYGKIVRSFLFTLFIIGIIWISTDDMMFKIISIMVLLLGWFFIIIIPSLPKKQWSFIIPTDYKNFSIASFVIAMICIILHMYSKQTVFMIMLFVTIIIQLLYMGMNGIIFKRFYTPLIVKEDESARYFGYIYIGIAAWLLYNFIKLFFPV